MDAINLQPIGTIHSPYVCYDQPPIQGIFESDAEGWIEIKEEYAPGLKDLEGFSHAFLIYFFHQSHREELVGRPYLEEDEHGIFAIRSPHRPNHLGLSVVRIQRIVDNRLYFTEVDVVDGTPLLDIKPYVTYFDRRDNVACGWIDRHFADRGSKVPSG